MRIRFETANRRRNGGFTLLELIVVLVLVAIIAAMVVVRWSGFQHGPAINAAVAKVSFLDAHMRQFARSRGRPCSLSFNLRDHSVRKQYEDSDGKNPNSELIGSNIQITDLDCRSIRTKAGQVEVTYYSDGTSASYGLQLAGSGDQQAFIVFAGISGELTRFQTASDYNHALELLKKAK